MTSESKTVFVMNKWRTIAAKNGPDAIAARNEVATIPMMKTLVAIRAMSQVGSGCGADKWTPTAALNCGTVDGIAKASATCRNM
jgi:hypothetical protein